MNVMDRQGYFAGCGFLLKTLTLLSLFALALLTSRKPWVGVALAAGLAAGAATLRCPCLPKWGLYAFVGLVPLSAIGAKLPFPVVDSLTKLVFLLTLGRFLIDSAILNRRAVTSSQGLLSLLYCGTAIVSYLLNEKMADSFSGLIRLVDLVILFLLAVSIFETGRDVAILFAMIVATCLVSALGGVFWPIQWPTGYGTAGTTRLSGWTVQNDAPTFALLLLTSVLICAYFLLTHRRILLRCALWPVTGFLVYAMSATAGRGAFIALVASFGYMLFLLRKRISMPLVAFSLLMITLVTIPLAPRTFYDRFHSIVTQPKREGSINWRIDSARVGFAMFLREPLFGCGPGNFTNEYMSEEFRFDRPVRPGSIIANTYVSVLYDTGFVGFCFLALLVGLSWRHVRFVRQSYEPFESDSERADGEREAPTFTRQAAEILEILLVAFLVSSFFGPIEKAKYFWVFLAVSGVLARIRREELASPLRKGSAEG